VLGEGEGAGVGSHEGNVDGLEVNGATVGEIVGMEETQRPHDFLQFAVT